MRQLFVKQILAKEITCFDRILDYICYNPVSIPIRHFFRFLKRLPKWLRLCWKTENWDYEGIYDFIEMQLPEMLKAQEEDDIHVPSEVNKRIKQIKLVLEHLKRYREPFDYYEWPEIHTVPSGECKGQTTYRMEFVDADGEEKAQRFHELENKHYEKFWKLFKQWHQGWWT